MEEAEKVQEEEGENSVTANSKHDSNLALHLEGVNLREEEVDTELMELENYDLEAENSCK